MYGTGTDHRTSTWNDLNGNDQTFSFIVETVPEPGIGELGGVALILCALRRRVARSGNGRAP